MAGPPAGWFEPRDEVVCCEAFEDAEVGEDHDPAECLAEQEQEAAEARAEAAAEDALWEQW